MENNRQSSGDRPTVMVTNDDGIDAPGLQALVRALVSSDQFQVYVSAPERYGPGGRRSADDYELEAEACLPIISGILAKIRLNTYPRNSFLNINVPADVVNHKGYRLTKPGNSMNKLGWKQVASQAQGEEMISAMVSDPRPSSILESEAVDDTKNKNLMFIRKL
ncbi:uncharacterized protein LOC121783813 isoform X1 [Salvia splendens]|uniref:uncharacterized protein LOC121783813 isoform X1 n=1 Tax=Salvia splendens TaxID=180675 RepID=UPI001C2577DD|nr:uncharacterized protein LOC121783813 isoform X1 [Salvia splendens]